MTAAGALAGALTVPSEFRTALAPGALETTVRGLPPTASRKAFWTSYVTTPSGRMFTERWNLITLRSVVGPKLPSMVVAKPSRVRKSCRTRTS